MNSTELDGTVALVTGGANGIGAAVARRLAGGGAHVVIADIDDEKGLALAAELDGLYVRCDVADVAIPALRARGGGMIVATASMAGLTPVAWDPIYVANKHAVVGFVRSRGEALSGDSIAVHALCPSITETALIAPLRSLLEGRDFPILDVAGVVDAFVQILDSDTTGQCWFVVVGRPSEPFRFRHAPGPRG